MKRKPIERIEQNIKELKEILERTKGVLSDEDYTKLLQAVETLGFLTSELQDKRTTIKRLRDLLFGPTTEKTSKVLGGSSEEEGEKKTSEATGDREEGKEEALEAKSDGGEKEKRKGHGRNGADAYEGAEKIEVQHENLKSGDPCPQTGCKGKVYKLTDPGVLVRIVGQAPLGAKVYELEKLRCNLCLTVFTAQAPEGIGEKKYNETAGSMVALLRYGTGVPFNRLRGLQNNLGIPLPASTQWDIVEEAAKRVAPAFAALIGEAAQGDVLHNDDTSMKILEFMKKKERKGDDG